MIGRTGSPPQALADEMMDFLASCSAAWTFLSAIAAVVLGVGVQ